MDSGDPAKRVTVELDDLIFALQRSGGATVYWREVTNRLDADRRLEVSRTGASRLRRGVPTISRAQVFHSSHFRISLGRARNVSTVHDLHYELGLMGHGMGASINLVERRVSYFTADALICISEHTRKDLLEVYPGLRGRCPIHVIHHGVAVPSGAGSDRDAPADDAPFVLYVGGRGGYKNFDAALQGYFLSGVWRDGVQLVCTGAPFSAAETQAFTRLGLSGLVSVLEHCSTESLFALYRRAHCLVYTSRYEGFGLPPLEAMAAGCPVVAANSSSIPEICMDAAILVDPVSADQVARAIHSVEDPAVRGALRQKGLARSRAFTWEKSAERHAGVYLDVAAGRQAR